jgi:flagellar assembly protein FliH
MAEPVKFKFDQDFDGGRRGQIDEEIAVVRAEMERAVQEARQQAFEDGKNQALSEIEAATLASLQQLGGTAQSLFDQRKQIETTMQQDMVQLAYGIASKLAPALMEREPMHEMEALIVECLQTVRNEPRLVIRVSEDMLDPLTARIDTLKKSAGFDGNIVVIGEENLANNDCHMEWAEGGTSRRYGEVQKQIETLVQKYVMAPSNSSALEQEPTRAQEQG